MLEEMIKSVFMRLISELYPHLRMPAIMTAEVRSMTDCGTYYEYSLRLLDASGMADGRCPEIPNVRSRARYEKGTHVAVALMYGTLDPYIIGEVL